MEEVDEVEAPKTVLSEMKGAFVSSLIRNNKKIREDRAISIAEDVEMLYSREIKDIEMEIKKLKRKREQNLDLSRNDTTSLVHANDFSPKEFISDDINLGINIRNAEIRLEIATARYNFLFKGE